MRTNLILAGAVFMLAPGWAWAEVADSSPNGFTVKVTLSIKAHPAVVYAKLVHNVGEWWDSSHTFSGDSRNLTIEEKPAGCFCEKLPNGGGVRHMEVVNLAPAKRLVLTGALGPLQSLAVTGSVAIAFSPLIEGTKDESTKLDVTYSVAGYFAAGMNTWASPVDDVVRQQFIRLKNYAESGDPARAK